MTSVPAASGTASSRMNELPIPQHQYLHEVQLLSSHTLAMRPTSYRQLSRQAPRAPYVGALAIRVAAILQIVIFKLVPGKTALRLRVTVAPHDSIPGTADQLDRVGEQATTGIGRRRRRAARGRQTSPRGLPRVSS